MTGGTIHTDNAFLKAFARFELRLMKYTLKNLLNRVSKTASSTGSSWVSNEDKSAQDDQKRGGSNCKEECSQGRHQITFPHLNGQEQSCVVRIMNVTW